VEAGFGLLASLVQPLSNGLPIKITSGLHTGCDKLLVPKDSGINKLTDLKGKRIGVPSMSSSPIIFAKRALADAGVGVSEKNLEVEFVVFSNSELPLALQKGAIDAIAANDPVAYIAAKEYNLNTIADSALTPPYKDQYCCSAYVRDTLASAHPDIAAKYTRAMQKASAWVQKNQDEAAKIQVEKKYVPGNAETNAAVLKTFNYIPSVKGAYDAFGITAKQLQDVGMLDKSVDVNALHQKSFTTFKDVQDTVQ
jgi:NitT/TauT family transport system substrate-binding protein